MLVAAVIAGVAAVVNSIYSLVCLIPSGHMWVLECSCILLRETCARLGSVPCAEANNLTLLPISMMFAAASEETIIDETHWP